MPKTKVPKSVAQTNDAPKKKKYINKALVKDLDFKYDDELFTSRYKNNPTSSKLSLSSLNVPSEETVKTEKISIPNYSYEESAKESKALDKDTSAKEFLEDSKKDETLDFSNSNSYSDKKSEENKEPSDVISSQDTNSKEVIDEIKEDVLSSHDEEYESLNLEEEKEENILPSVENNEDTVVHNTENYKSNDLSEQHTKSIQEDETANLYSEKNTDESDVNNQNISDTGPESEMLSDNKSAVHESSIPSQLSAEELAKLNSCIEMTAIRKTFGTIVANDLINLNVKKGTVHALIGENGAGKSTLMSILFGIYSPDSGIIKINGNITEISSPEQANALGIGMVHQHFKQVDNMTVLQNIVLGNEISNIWSGFINYREDRVSIIDLMDKYNLKLDLSSMVSELSVSEQQKLEIIKVLYKRSEIIIFDEPTAVLSPNEIKDFLKLVKDLKKDGRTIIIISHKIPELKEVADEATVIRLGRTIKTFEMASMNNSEIAKLMVGREVKESKYPKNPHPYNADSILSVKDLVIHDSTKNVEKVKSVSFDVKAGEILGIAGVEGSGQKEIVDAISGLGKISSGSITINSKGVLIDISKASIKRRYNNGMAFIPEDRHKHGLVLDETVNNNISLRNVDKFSILGFVNYSKINKFGSKVCKDYDVRNSENGFAIARSLSGGNQQKVILGRELTSPSSFIVIFQPTRGLDVGSIEYVHSQIIEAKKQNKAILLVSYELEEIIGICDRVLVMNSGYITGELNGNDININNIGEKMIASSKEVS